MAEKEIIGISYKLFKITKYKVKKKYRTIILDRVEDLGELQDYTIERK